MVTEADIFHVLGHLSSADVLSAHLLCHSGVCNCAVWTPQSSEKQAESTSRLAPHSQFPHYRNAGRLVQAAEGKPDEQVDQKLSVVTGRQKGCGGQAGRQGDRSSALRKVSPGNVTL